MIFTHVREDEYCPKDTFTTSIGEGTIWEESIKEGRPVLCAIPTIAPIPFGTSIKLLIFDEAFISEMKEISPAHSFWVDSMAEVMEQYALDGESDIPIIVNNLVTSKETSKARDLCNAATKGLHTHTFVEGPFIKTIIVNAGTMHIEEQADIRSFFYQNPTPQKLIESVQSSDDYDDESSAIGRR